MAKPQVFSPRWVTWAVVAIALAAATLRMHDLGRSALSHFDEGVYAMTADWLFSYGTLYPNQEKHAPLAYPVLVGIGYQIAGGPSAAVAVAVNALLGVGTCLILFWLGRRLFGLGVGLASAALLAVNDFHIVLCKSALVDPLFVLLFVASLGLLYRCLSSGKWPDAVAAGLVVGAAWNTKYNGFLPLGIVLAAMALEHLRARWASPPGDMPPARQWVRQWLTAAVVAGLCYLPWALYVDSTIGYAELTEHQRGYLRHWTHWADHARILLGDLAVFRHVGTGLLVLALVGSIGLGAVRRWGPPVWLLGAGLAALAAIVYGGVEAVCLAAGLCGSFYAFTRGTRGDRLIAVWVLTLVSITPLYTPYARLALPLVPGLLLLTARWVQVTLREAAQAPSRRIGIEVTVAVVLSIGLSWVGGRLFDVPLQRWQASFAGRGGYAALGEAIGRSTEPGAWIVYHAQPTLAFHCPRYTVPTGANQDLSERVEKIVANLQAAGTDELPAVYVAVDFIVYRDSQSAVLNSFETGRRRWKPVMSIAANPGLLQWLDERHASGYWRELKDPPAEASKSLRLICVYRAR